MMNKLKKIAEIRSTLKKNECSIGSWMQIPNASVAEIMGDAGYDWVAIDLEHGAFSLHLLPDIFRALELGNTLPLVRLAQGHPKDCKQALDAGAGGVIIPMVESAEQLIAVRDACRWPPAGKRGVGFSRANLFGKYFENYRKEAQAPLLVAMIEHVSAVKNIKSILAVEGLDAILIGPYDLSASMNKTADFEDEEFKKAMNTILIESQKAKISCGLHVVQPSKEQLKQRQQEGYKFLAYSIDAVMFNSVVKFEKN